MKQGDFEEVPRLAGMTQCLPVGWHDGGQTRAPPYRNGGRQAVRRVRCPQRAASPSEQGDFSLVVSRQGYFLTSKRGTAAPFLFCYLYYYMRILRFVSEADVLRVRLLAGLHIGDVQHRALAVVGLALLLLHGSLDLHPLAVLNFSSPSPLHTRARNCISLLQHTMAKRPGQWMPGNFLEWHISALYRTVTPS